LSILVKKVRERRKGRAKKRGRKEEGEERREGGEGESNRKREEHGSKYLKCNRQKMPVSHICTKGDIYSTSAFGDPVTHY
jgi:hypothetical protein